MLGSGQRGLELGVNGDLAAAPLLDLARHRFPPGRVRLVHRDLESRAREDHRPADADRPAADDRDPHAGAAALRWCARHVVAQRPGSFTREPSTWWIAWLCGAVLTVSGSL